MSHLSSSALHAAWREEKHRYPPGGVPAYTYSKDLQIPSAVEGRKKIKFLLRGFGSIILVENKSSPPPPLTVSP